MTGRFIMLDDAERKRLNENSRNLNTSRSPITLIGAFQRWAEWRNFNPAIEQYEPSDLDSKLGMFYSEIRKTNGQDYEPDCLAVMQSALDRHLTQLNYPLSIARDKEFKESQGILQGKCLELRQAGVGKRPNARRAITQAEEQECWAAGNLGDWPPKVFFSFFFSPI